MANRNLHISLVTAIGLSLTTLAYCKSKTEWESRVIYQVLTDRFSSTDGPANCTNLEHYCGGTFRGLINKLDYIQDLGANAIWISPVVENTENGYHGYWAKDIYNINPHFGSSDDLMALVDACHKRDIWVMVDVVANHMGYPPGCPSCPMTQRLNFTGFVPFNMAAYYHNYCEIKDWSNQTQVELCRLAELPDLNQTDNLVRQLQVVWVLNLTRFYHFDGIRIDTVPEVHKDFWKEFSQAAAVFSIGEVDNGDISYNARYQGPMDSVLNYPMYFTLRHVYQEKQSPWLINQALRNEAAIFKDTKVLGGFLDNHDNPRFLCINDDWTSLKNGLTYSLMAKWIPIIYYGTEQGFRGCNDPNNREALWPHYDKQHDMYQFISTVLRYRSSVVQDLMASAQTERWVDDKIYAFTRGTGEKILVVTTNQGSGSTVEVTIPNLPYPDHTVLQNVLDESEKVESNFGRVTLTIQNGQPKIYHVLSGQFTWNLDAGYSTGVDYKVAVIVGISVVAVLALVVYGASHLHT
ncbi:uncharacterized protein LOC135479591 [Liolophura sinensis]|uniref:uncharacterized protein LOC135479591 n=1 Tax=Liolophura sinensis TaxID=3198878 RepID=UPI0031587F91